MPMSLYIDTTRRSLNMSADVRPKRPSCHDKIHQDEQMRPSTEDLNTYTDVARRRPRLRDAHGFIETRGPQFFALVHRTGPKNAKR